MLWKVLSVCLSDTAMPMINGVVLILCREHDWRVQGGGGGTATRRATLDGLSLMRRCIFLIIMCATVRTKLGPTGLATAASVNNFLGKNKELTRNLFIVTAECLPCLRGTEWCNVQCVFICVQRGVILWDETALYSFNFPHMTYPLINQLFTV